VASTLQLLDVPHDGDSGYRHSLPNLAPPFLDQVRRAEQQHPPTTSQVGCRGSDGRLSYAHLAYDDGPALVLERQRNGTDGVGLGTEGSAAKATQVERARPTSLGIV
jgi:hypothetical protein